MTTTRYLLERAWLGDAVHDDVSVTIQDGRFTAVSAGQHEAGDDQATRLPGLTLPGLANCHSHAFHRALRGRTQHERGSFWTWREQMYSLAGLLDPDQYFALARATYREMAASGITGVAEFHYLHHQADGTPYADPNQMGQALVAAAADAGIRITLLDTCYLSSGFGAAPSGVQVRYADADAQAWTDRFAALDALASDQVVVGAAIHSIRAVPREHLGTVVRAAAGRPLHVHLSEQRAENDDCLATYGATPTRVLAEAGVWSPTSTAVHATHLTEEDIALLGDAGAYACFCPTTERDLGDGIGPSRPLHEAGAHLTLGSDSHAVIDLFEEMRAVELNERLASQSRGHWSATELLTAASRVGHRSLGFADAGQIAVGMRADLVTVSTTSPSTAGTGASEATAVFAVGAADVTQVMVEGRVVARAEERPELGRELDAVIDRLWQQVAR